MMSKKPKLKRASGKNGRRIKTGTLYTPLVAYAPGSEWERGGKKIPEPEDAAERDYRNQNLAKVPAACAEKGIALSGPEDPEANDKLLNFFLAREWPKGCRPPEVKPPTRAEKNRIEAWYKTLDIMAVASNETGIQPDFDEAAFEVARRWPGKYGKTEGAVRIAATRGKGLDQKRPQFGLKAYGAIAHKLDANHALHLLDELAVYSQRIHIVGTYYVSESPLAAASFNRLLRSGANVTLGGDFAPARLSEFESLVAAAAQENVTGRFKKKNKSGVVIIDAEPDGDIPSEYASAVRDALSALGFRPRLILDSNAQPPRSGERASVYLLCLRKYVPPELLSRNAARRPAVLLQNSYRARMNAEEAVREAAAIKEAQEREASVKSNRGILGGILGNAFYSAPNSAGTVPVDE